MSIYADFETWKVITYPGVKADMYQISNFGNIINIKRNKPVKIHIDKDGYMRTWLVGNTKKIVAIHVHRLVAWEFIEHRRDIELCINHKDCVRHNNYYRNLEWVTYRENNDYLKQYGNFKTGELVYNCKYSNEIVENIIELLCTGNYTVNEVTEAIMNKFKIDNFNSLRKFIYRIVNRETREDLIDGREIIYRRERKAV